VAMLMSRFRVSQRIACRVMGQPRATQRYQAIPRADESALTHAVVELANLDGRYGYRTVTISLTYQTLGRLRKSLLSPHMSALKWVCENKCKVSLMLNLCGTFSRRTILRKRIGGRRTDTDDQGLIIFVFVIFLLSFDRWVVCMTTL